ncbi:MAG TPA: hypothetical protein VD995_15185 [Azospirillum sp.]|nr:hypothetical protein [Azospirillum sp.]
MTRMPTASDSWLPAIRRYLAVVALANLGWEFAHMPLYALWRDGTAADIVFAAVHCTGGDILIALSSLVLALVVAGTPEWPQVRFLPVAGLILATGFGYTVFSEWLNVEVRRSWAYSDLMPVLPWLGTGLSPLAQWLVVPGLALWAIRPGATCPAGVPITREQRP